MAVGSHSSEVRPAHDHVETQGDVQAGPGVPGCINLVEVGIGGLYELATGGEQALHLLTYVDLRGQDQEDDPGDQ